MFIVVFIFWLAVVDDNFCFHTWCILCRVVVLHIATFSTLYTAAKLISSGKCGERVLLLRNTKLRNCLANGSILFGFVYSQKYIDWTAEQVAKSAYRLMLEVLVGSYFRYMRDA